MPGGGRGFIAALAGLAALFTVFGLGLMLGALSYPEKQRYEPYRYATDKPQEIDPAAAGQASAKVFEIRTPCENPKGRDESDLCAQWSAATAAREAADWAWWTMVFSGFGVVGLGGTLMLTARSTMAATRQAKISEKTFTELERPYLFVEVDRQTYLAELDRDQRGEIRGKYSRFKVLYRVSNYGRTAAVDVVCRVSAFWGECPENDIPYESMSDVSKFDVVSSTDTVEANAGAGSRTDWEVESETFVVRGVLTYSDVAGNPYRTDFEWLGHRGFTGTHATIAQSHNVTRNRRT